MHKKPKAGFVKVKRNSTVEFIKRETENRMKTLGTYKPEYDDLITVYADTLRQYHRAYAQFIKDGEKYEVDTGTGSTKKSGTVSSIETLRKDLVTLSDRLLLNPRYEQTAEEREAPPQKMDTEDLLGFLNEKLSA